MAENKEILTHEIPQQETYIKDVGIETNINKKELISRDIATWMEKVEQNSVPTQTITDNNGQPLLSPVAPINPKIVLPITRKTFVQGFKKTIEDAGRWLSVFILRLIKIKEGNVKFREE